VLVLWVLCLGALLGSLALAVKLGDLDQQVVNVQDAADAAALAAAEKLAPELPLAIYQSVPACDPVPSGARAQCPCPLEAQGQLAPQCHDYRWLDDGTYYIYLQGQGWAQISDARLAASAFQVGLAAGWSCSKAAPSGKRCETIATNVQTSAPGALTDSTTVYDLAQAAQAAQDLASSSYFGGQTSSLDWGACGQVPAGFALATFADDCVAYEAGASAYQPSGAGYFPSDSSSLDYVIFFVTVPASRTGPTRQATATWAAGPQGAGAPSSPYPPFGPLAPSGKAWLCSLTAATCP